MGARPLRRIIENEVESILADKIISGEFAEGETLTIDADEYGLIFKK
jgi:ATP-dependent Clp protease ATP-binding subunit ClpC